MQTIPSRIGLLGLALLLTCSTRAVAQIPHITVSFPAARNAQPIDERLLFLLSTDPSAEPRMQIDDTPKSQIIFGMSVNGMRPHAGVTMDCPIFCTSWIVTASGGRTCIWHRAFS